MIVRIFIVLLMVLGVSVGESFAARAPSYASGARDMSELLSIHESIDHLTGTGRTYRAFVSSERDRVDQILQKYAYISRILTIRPTLDRSLSYHLRIQKYSLSCEITATQIVLEALGILQTEPEILDQIPQLPSRLSGGIWGDPDREFVGSYRGSQ